MIIAFIFIKQIQGGDYMKNTLPWLWKKESGVGLRQEHHYPEWGDCRFSTPIDMYGDIQPNFSNSTLPIIDVLDNANDFVIKAEISGMDEQDLTIEYHEGSVTLKGEKKTIKGDKQTKVQERWEGSFSRTIHLGENYNFKKAKARYKKGILTVEIPKIKQKSSKKTITIQ